MNLRPGRSAEAHARGELIWQLLVAALACALYARTVAFGWAFDDSMEVVHNAYVHSLSRFGELVRTTTWTGSGMETYLYRPVTMATYALNHAVSGLAPWSYHLVNAALHAGVTVLVFRVGRTWGLPLLAAGLGALIFAVHPVHVEAVANVVGRRDVLAALFVLMAALTHRAALVRGGWRMAAAPLCLLAAMMSKEVGVVGIGLVAVQDAYLEGGVGGVLRKPRAAFLYVAHAAMVLLFLAVRVRVVGGLGVAETFYWDNPIVAAPGPVGLATALVVLGKGAALLVAPLSLSPDYSFDAIPLVRTPLDLRLVGTALLAVLAAWSLIGTGLRRSVAVLALAWYGISVLPTSNLLVQVGTIFGERLLYLPSVAFCLAAGAAVAALMRRMPSVVRGALAVYLVALTLQTVRYTGAWTDDVTLFRWAVAAEPNSTKAHHKLGEELLRAGLLGPALGSLQRAMAIAPDNEFAASTLARARAEVAERYGHFDPSRLGESGAPTDPDVLYALGQLGRAGGDMAAAVGFWEAAVEADSTHPGALSDLGSSALAAGDTAVAHRLLDRAVRVESRLASAWFNLAQIHLARRNDADAIAALEMFIQAAGPRYPDQVAWARRMLPALERRVSGSSR